MPTQSQNPEKFKNLTTMQKMSIELEDFKVIIKNIAEENNNIKEKYNAIKEESAKKDEEIKKLKQQIEKWKIYKLTIST